MSGSDWLDVLLAFIAVILLAGSWLALLYAHRQRRVSCLPVGRITYADTGDWRRPEKPLFSGTFNLVGRPDYVVSTRAGVIPVEVKSGSTPDRPRESHVMQLAAYCLLVQDTQRKSPPYGLIRYPQGTFQVDYTSVLRRELLKVLEAMRNDGQRADVQRSHDEPRRCALCGYSDVCDEALA